MVAPLDIDWESLDWTRSDHSLALDLGCAHRTVNRWRKKLGYETWSRTDFDDATAWRYYQKERSYRDVAFILGCSSTGAVGAVKRHQRFLDTMTSGCPAPTFTSDTGSESLW